MATNGAAYATGTRKYPTAAREGRQGHRDRHQRRDRDGKANHNAAARASSRHASGHTRRSQSAPVERQVVEDRRVGKDGAVTVARRYLKTRLLGKGGFARCYKFTGMDRHNHNQVFAGKVVKKSSLKKKSAREKLKAEIVIHKSLKHDRIVRFETYFEDDDNVYIVLDLCENQSLMELLRRRKRLSEEEVKFYMLQMLEALKYLHANLVIHRDLKLSNVFLARGMKVKIGDFGLAAKLDSPTQKRTTICGTPNYLAPEILDGRKAGGHSFEVDVWSMGVIMYTLLVGRPPFETNDVKATYKKIRANSYAFPSGVHVSEHAKSLIRWILHTSPTARPTINDIVNHPFFTHPKSYIPTSLPDTSLRAPPVLRADQLVRGSRRIAQFLSAAPAIHHIGSTRKDRGTGGQRKAPPPYALGMAGKTTAAKTAAAAVSGAGSCEKPKEGAGSASRRTGRKPLHTVTNTAAGVTGRGKAKQGLCGVGAGAGASDRRTSRQRATASGRKAAVVPPPRATRTTTAAPTPGGIASGQPQEWKLSPATRKVPHASPCSRDRAPPRSQAWATASTHVTGPKPVTATATVRPSNVNVRAETGGTTDDSAPRAVSHASDRATARVVPRGGSPGRCGGGRQSDERQGRGVRCWTHDEEPGTATPEVAALPAPTTTTATATATAAAVAGAATAQRAPEEGSSSCRWAVPVVRTSDTAARSSGLESGAAAVSLPSGAGRLPSKSTASAGTEAAITRSTSSRGSSRRGQDEAGTDGPDVPASSKTGKLQHHRPSVRNGRTRSGGSGGKLHGAKLADMDTLRDMHEHLSVSFAAHVGGAAPDATTLESEGLPAPSSWVCTWVDYTSKYGLGYLLSDGAVGVYFNDSTKIILASDNNSLEYVERSSSSSGRRRPIIRQRHTLDSYPDSLTKKVTLLKHFRGYLLEQYRKTCATSKAPEEVEAMARGSAVVNMTFVKKWVRTRHAVLFRLSNQQVQVNFFDHTSLLLSSQGRLVTYVDKKGVRTTQGLGNILASKRSDLSKRLQYTKDILQQLISGARR